MAKSLKKELSELGELCAMVELKRENITCVSLYACGTPSICVRPLELARIARELQIPRKKIDFTTSEDGNLHISFTARGADWRAFVPKKEIAEFHGLLNTQFLRLTSQPKRLPQPRRRLYFEEAP